MSDARALLHPLLERARDRGFLGPGPVETHLDHADAFARVVETAWAGEAEGNRRAGPPAVTDGHAVAREAADEGAASAVDPPGRVLELGAGGGVPGLVLAVRWTQTSFVLLDAAQRRVELLRQACEKLGLAARVEVALARAEELGHEAGQRGGFDAVVARSFGPPAVTAECAAPFLRVGGILVVSEPPLGQGAGDGPGRLSGATDRQGPEGRLPAAPGGRRWPAEGLAVLGMGTARVVSGRYTFAVVPQHDVCPERFARRVGVPAKRPLF